VRLRLWPLLSLRVELGDFILKRPMISLVQAPDGRWNFTTLGVHSEPRPTGRTRSGGGGAGLSARPGSWRPPEDRKRRGDLRDTSPRGRRALPRRGPRSGRHRRPQGALTLKGDAKVKPGDVAVKISDGSLAMNGARTLADASVRAKITVEGKEIRELIALALGPEPAIDGGVKGTLTLGGTVGHAKANGEIELMNLVVTQTRPACPEPKKRSLALGNVKINAAWEAPRFTGRPVTGSVAGGSLTTNATVTLEQAIHVDLTELALKGVAIEKVLVDFLCQGYAVTGPTDDTGSLGVRLDDLWHTLNGQGQLKIGPGRVVGSQALAALGNLARVGGAVAAVLGSELPNLGSSPVEYDSITASYTITNGVVTTRDFALSGRTIKITAAGSYALASGALNLDVGVATGRAELRGKVTGTASAPSVRVAPPTALRDVDPAKVEKGLEDLLKRFR